MSNKPDSEAALEQAAMNVLADLGYDTHDAYHEVCGEFSALGRHNRGEVVLLKYLRPALEKLNPDVPDSLIDDAINILTADRNLKTLPAANQDFYQLIRDRVKVPYRDADGTLNEMAITVIDWENPSRNHFLAVQQLWCAGDYYTKRPDIICFINGLPLVLLELKAHTVSIQHAFHDNITDYKDTIPQLFWYNGFIILSNGSQSLMGSLTAGLDHFFTWKRINREGEKGIVSIDTLLKGVCEKSRLLDLLENYILFKLDQGGLHKLVGKNHQYLGVNNAVEAVRQIEQNNGRLGVFWHTQGSGKSYSMVFFSQKVIRKIPGNWSFVVVTDREDLDNQIYDNFTGTGAVIEDPDTVRADSGDALKQLLRDDHRYVFTLIQKFHTRDGNPYPVLSDRSDIIVMTDEAHRSQYATFAANMRAALPNAAFIGFTGTPLIAASGEKTREEFGDYISIYNFKQSVDDQATVPLWYENRIPELELTNVTLNDDLEQLLDDQDAQLDEAQTRALEKEFAREYHLITRDDRLDAIAEDIVDHYLIRGFEGQEYDSKAMVISIDKATAVKMYDRVTAHWQAKIGQFKGELEQTPDDQIEEQVYLSAVIDFMETTQMRVVVSSEQNEVKHFRDKGLDIKTHRQRMNDENLEENFKNPNHPFRVVFVCAMWITGFDAPSCATIYLDKPMRNHTLMQTIARANRVFKTKPNGLIVDYIGVFRNLQKALAIYGASTADEQDDYPARAKAILIDKLDRLAKQVDDFCLQHQIDLQAIHAADTLHRIARMDEAVDVLNSSDQLKHDFLDLSRQFIRLYKSALPHPDATTYGALKLVLQALVEKLRDSDPDVDISHIVGEVEALLDESIKHRRYVIDKPVVQDPMHLIDLSQVDFEALEAQFKRGYKHTEAEKLKSAIERKLDHMIKLNTTRLDLQERFEQMIDAYNSGSRNVERHFQELVVFAQGLNAEDQRAIAEQLSEEELAVFDLLTKPDTHRFTKAEIATIKSAVHEMLETLKREKLKLDWRKDPTLQAAVKVYIKDQLDQGLPTSITPEEYEMKCALVYQHIHDAYAGNGQSVYNTAA